MTRTHSILRTIAYIFGAWLLGIAAVALYLNHFDWNRARPYVAKYSKKFLGREVRVDGDLDLRLGVHPILIANNVSYENAAWAGREPAFQADHLEVKLDVWPAFKDVLQVPYVRLSDARLNIVTRDDGSSNLVPSQDSGKEAGKKADSSPLDLRLLTVDLARVVISYDSSLNVAIAALTAKQAGVDDVQVDGKARVNGLPADLTATARHYLKAFQGDAPFDFNAKAHLGELSAAAAGEIKSLSGLAGFSLDASVKGENAQNVAKAFGLTLNDRVPSLALDAHVSHEAAASTTWKIEKTALRLGESRATGDVTVTLRDPPRIVAHVQAPLVRFADLGALLPKAAADELPATRKETARQSGQPTRLFSAAPLPLAALRRLDLDVTFAVDKFVGDGKSAVVTAFHGRVEAREGKLAVRPFDADVAGGHVHTETSIDANAKPLQFVTKSTVERVDIGRLLQPYLVADDHKGVKIGKLNTDHLFAGNLNGHVNLKANGDSIRALMGGLDGDVGLALEDGKMSSLIIEALGMDVTEAIGSLLAKKQTVEMPCLITSLEAKSGQIKPRVIIASTKDSDVVVEGQLNLQDETVDALISTHPKDFSIGAFRTPIKLKGPFYKVHVDVVRQQLGARIAAAVGLGVFVNPLAALLPLIEPGLTKDGACLRYVGEIKRAEAH